MKIDASSVKILGILGIALVGVFVLVRVKGLAKDLGSAPVAAVGGAVETVGEIVGLPKTDEQKCELAIKAGNRLEASFVCGAPRFVSALWRGEFGNAEN
jgi:hypothetical protein